MKNIYKILMLILALSIITQTVSALEDGKDYKCVDKVATESPPSDSKITEKPLCSEGKVPQTIAKDDMQDIIMQINDNDVESAQCFSGKCWDFASSRQNINNKGVSARLTQHNPAIDLVQGYASFASIMSGTSSNRVEVGWAKAKNGITKLFVRWWKNNAPYGSNFNGWVQTSSHYYPTMPLSVDNYGKTYSIKNSNGNWWIAYNGEWMGYYPGSLWNWGFNTGTYALYTGGVISYVPVTTTDMGNGLWASNTNAAKIVSQQYIGTNGIKYNANTYKYSTSPNLYSVVSTGSNSMRYGGPGSTGPKITVTFPNGGETLWSDMTYNIKWLSSGNPGPYVKIQVLKAGYLYTTLSYSTPNDGNFDWQPAWYPDGNDYKIKISSTSNPAISDTSNNNFEILWYPDAGKDRDS